MNYNLNKCFSYYIACIPILQYYISPISMFNFATFLAIIFGTIFLTLTLKNGVFIFPKNKSIIRVVEVYFIFLITNTLITFSYHSYEYSWANLSSLVRTIAIMVCILVLGSSHFDFKSALEGLSFLQITSSVLIVFQTLSHLLFGNRIKVVIGSLLTEKGYALGERFSGLYMEPSHFAQSAIVFLICTVFTNSNQEKKLGWKQLLVIFGVILSGSGQGYLYIFIFLIILFFYKLIKMKQSKNKVLKSLFFIAGGMIITIILLQTSTVKNALARLFYEDGSLGGQALSGRTWTNDKFDALSPIEKEIGLGYGHIFMVTSGYVNSLYTHLIECGYWSLFFLYQMFIPPLISKDAKKIVLSLYCVVMTYFTSIAASMSLCFYLLFIYSDYEDKKTGTIRKGSN